MQEIGQLLEDYEDLLQRYRAIIERELRNLKESGQLDFSLESEKKQVVDDLSRNLASLKSFRESNESLEPALRARLNQLQQKFMQVIKLERELEKNYLGQQADRAGAIRSQAKQGVNLAAARRLYGLS